jgi:hypothetical protein
MSTPFHTTVDLAGTHFSDFHLTMNISGSGLTYASVVGKPLALDTTAANTVKIAGNGDRIVGYARTFEDRINEGTKLVTVETKFIMNFPVTAADALAVGDTAVGGTNAGEVKKGTAAPNDNIVLKVASGIATVARGIF